MSLSSSSSPLLAANQLSLHPTPPDSQHTMPPKRGQKGSKQSSKAPSKAASKAPSGANTPRAPTEPQTPVKQAPGLLGLNFGQSFSSVAIIDKVRPIAFPLTAAEKPG